MSAGLSTARTREISDGAVPAKACILLDTQGRAAYPCRPSFRPTMCLFSRNFRENFRERRNETHLSTEQSASPAHSRVSRTHGHASGPSGSRPAPRERSQASHGVSRCARSAAPLTPRRFPCLPLGRSNPRNASGKNPNSIACIVTRAARPTRSSRYLRETAAQPFPALDWRSPPASWGMRCAVIASSVSSGNRFVSISMNCLQWISSSMRAPVRAMRITQRSRAASKGTGAE